MQVQILNTLTIYIYITPPRDSAVFVTLLSISIYGNCFYCPSARHLSGIFEITINGLSSIHNDNDEACQQGIYVCHACSYYL